MGWFKRNPPKPEPAPVVLSELEERLYNAVVAATKAGEIRWKFEKEFNDRWYHGSLFIERDETEDDNAFVSIFLHPNDNPWPGNPRGPILKIDNDKIVLDPDRAANLIELIDEYIKTRKAELLERFLRTTDEL